MKRFGAVGETLKGQGSDRAAQGKFDANTAGRLVKCIQYSSRRGGTVLFLWIQCGAVVGGFKCGFYSLIALNSIIRLEQKVELQEGQSRCLKSRDLNAWEDDETNTRNSEMSRTVFSRRSSVSFIFLLPRRVKFPSLQS
jgi:hypothetical protein